MTGQCFPVKSKVTCKNLAHLDEVKKYGLKVTYVIIAGTPSLIDMDDLFYIVMSFKHLFAPAAFHQCSCLCC